MDGSKTMSELGTRRGSTSRRRSSSYGSDSGGGDLMNMNQNASMLRQVKRDEAIGGGMGRSGRRGASFERRGSKSKDSAYKPTYADGSPVQTFKPTFMHDVEGYDSEQSPQHTLLNASGERVVHRGGGGSKSLQSGSKNSQGSKGGMHVDENLPMFQQNTERRGSVMDQYNRVDDSRKR